MSWIKLTENRERVRAALLNGYVDVPPELVLRELAVMPLLRIPNPHQAPTYLFQFV